MDDEGQSAIEQISVSVLPDGRMSRNQTARYLGLAPQTLASWASRGFGPQPIKLGGKVFYRRADVDAFIRGGKAA